MRRVLLAEELLKCPARLVVRDSIAAATPWMERASCPFLMFTTGWKPVPLTVLATGVPPVPLYNGEMRRVLLDEPCCNLPPKRAKAFLSRISRWLDAHPPVAAICVAYSRKHVPAGFDREPNLGCSV